MAVEGRPLVHGGQMLRPGIAVLPAARDAEGRAVRDHYASSAQLELSSVWTFLRLAEELAAVGAPAALIAAALDAADDEVRHAELCAAAAGGVELWSLPGWVARPRFDRRSAQALAVLARRGLVRGLPQRGRGGRGGAAGGGGGRGAGASDAGGDRGATRPATPRCRGRCSGG